MHASPAIPAVVAGAAASVLATVDGRRALFSGSTNHCTYDLALLVDDDGGDELDDDLEPRESGLGSGEFRVAPDTVVYVGDGGLDGVVNEDFAVFHVGIIALLLHSAIWTNLYKVWGVGRA